MTQLTTLETLKMIHLVLGHSIMYVTIRISILCKGNMALCPKYVLNCSFWVIFYNFWDLCCSYNTQNLTLGPLKCLFVVSVDLSERN